MAVRLLNANHDIVAAAMQMLGLLDGQIDRIILVVAMANHPTLLVDHILAI